MRPLHFFLSVLLAAIIGGGGWFAYRLWHRQQARAIAISGIAAQPDLSRYPKEFAAEVKKNSRAVAQVQFPAVPLGQLARLYQANGYNTEATRALHALRRLEPKNPRWSYYLTDLCLKANDRIEAERLLKETIKFAGDYSPALLSLGEMLVAQKHFDEAQDYLQSCANLSPGDPRPQVSLALIESSRGARVAALRRLTETLQANPRFAPAQHLMAELLAKAGDRAGAAEHLRLEQAANRTFTARDPWIDDLGECCYDSYRLQLLALAHFNAGKFEDALPLLERAVRLSPQEEENYNLLSTAYESLRRWEDAARILQAGIDQAPQASGLYVRLGILLSQNKRADEAVILGRRAVGKWPEKAELHAALARALEFAQQPSDAAEEYRAALALNSNLADAHLNLANCLLHLGQNEEAKLHLEQAIHIRPNYAEAFISLSGLANAEGNLATAEAYAEKVISLQPEQLEAKKFFARFQLYKANHCARDGKMAEAEIAYRRGIEVDPSMGMLHAGLGMVYLTARRLPEAIQELQQYVKTAPEDVNSYLLLAHALTDAGRPKEAQPLLERGLSVAQHGGAETQILVPEFQRLLGK